MTVYKIGLTGLIGSGKSLVANYFANLGIDIIDTDIISHMVTASNGVATSLIAKQFGKQYLDQDDALDRDKMRNLIFNDKQQKYKLEAILHPLIFEEVDNQIKLSTSMYVIIVVPLLFSLPMYTNYINRSIFIDCDESVLIARVMNRNGWDYDMVLKVLNNQMPRHEQLNIADDVITNNKTKLELELEVKKLHNMYTNII
jgi:dephospho-CoA kinase